MMHTLMTHKYFHASILISALGLAFSSGAHSQTTVSDDFTQGNDPNSWQTFNGACLTAGDGTGSIPACVGLPYYKGQIQVGGNSGYLGQSTVPATGNSQAPDPVGKGALRFTNGYTAGDKISGYHQAGSIISSGTPFSSASGLSVIFKTVTYRGDSQNGDGADGMGFFLMDGSLAPYDTGAFGGSLGYTCSNNKGNNDSTLRADGSVRGYDGLVGGYIGLGMDEYGNFLNFSDNTATGPNQTPGRIGLRGAGSISWAWLNAHYPAFYPSALAVTPDSTYVTKARAAVRDTCRTGFLWDYSNSSAPTVTATAVADYGAIPGASVVVSTLLPGKLIANEAAVTRNDGTPITYNLKITQDGILSLYVSYTGGTYLPVISKQKITTSNGPLPASFRFGFSGSTGGSNNIHEIMCFQAGPADLAGTSVGINKQEATKVASGTQAYLAYYYPATWTGRLTASDLLYDSATQSISIAAKANWDAQCNLTGVATGTCPTTNAPAVIPAQAPASRTMLTWSGSQGEAFEWNVATSGSALGAGQQASLDQGDATPINANRLNYLRGDRSNEINTSGVGIFRPRDGVLGDIIDSSPTWVGPPASPYAAVWKDLLVTADPTSENSGSQSYAQFTSTAQTRLNVVYTGANDGFLHGFRTGSYSSAGVYVNDSTTPNDGQEILAYMPGAVLQTIHNATNGTLDFSNSQYSHNFYVDATPEVDELFYGGVWHSWLIGGLGAGGSAIYALDVTDPSNFSEANASTVVKGEWTAASITCGNVSACGNNLGNTYGTPVIRRLHDGKWGIIFGNGFGSTSGDAGIYVMILDPSTGATSTANTYYLSTGKSGANGIAYVTPADLDGDHITDYVYAGDLLGNVWRFDLTSASESSWGAASAPLFTATAGQPITTRVAVSITPKTAGARRVIVDFGTGRKFPQTVTVPEQFASGSQSLYGIWDWNMANWNSLSATQLASLAAPQTVALSNLTTQTLTPVANSVLDVTSNPVCWAGSTTCTSGNTQFGWTVALPGAGEQLIFNPLLYGNAFILNTTIAAVNSPTSCVVLHDTGNTIALSTTTGGSLGSTTSGSFFKNSTDTNAAGQQTNGTGQPFIVQAGGNAFLLTQTLGDAPPGGPGSPIKCPPGSLVCSGRIPPPGGNASWRLTWTERR